MSNSLLARPLAREIIAVLLLKLVVIFIIKFAFFSDPVEMSEGQLEKVIVTPSTRVSGATGM